jgi:NifB/MoaA-like Fe-S oxidoreductase
MIGVIEGRSALEPQSISPFESIESAQEYLALLAQAVAESCATVKADVEAPESSATQRHLEALRLIVYNLEKLEQHVKVSRRILNDLRTLRRLLHQERTSGTVPADTAA